MGTPVGGVHDHSLLTELVGQSQGRGRTCGDYRLRHPLAQHTGGSIGCGSPAEADHGHRQGRHHHPKQELAPIFPCTSHQTEHHQGEAEQGRQQTEGAKRLDLEHHQAQQHQAEYGHGRGEQRQTPPAAAVEFAAGLAWQHQGQNRHKEDSQVGQATKQGQGLAEKGAPDTVQYLVAAITTPRTKDRTQNPPTLEGDDASVDGPNRGQHGDRDPQPATGGLGASPLVQTTGQAA